MFRQMNMLPMKQSPIRTTVTLASVAQNLDTTTKMKIPMITVVDRSGVHEIGVSWCCCHEAPERDMQLVMAGFFPATFHNPKTAFTFQMLGDFHLDNLECKTMLSQFFSRLRRLTNDEFPNTVPVG
jgi:hypothetical protein